MDQGFELQRGQSIAISKIVRVLSNAAMPTRTMVLPLLPASFDATAAALLATAGEALQLIIQPYDDCGNRANVTNPGAYRVTVEATARVRRRSTLEATSISPAVLDVSASSRKLLLI